jgi:hypothetical protein
MVRAPAGSPEAMWMRLRWSTVSAESQGPRRRRGERTGARLTFHIDHGRSRAGALRLPRPRHARLKRAHPQSALLKPVRSRTGRRPRAGSLLRLRSPASQEGTSRVRLRAGQRADRRGASPQGLGFATTGALLNHGAQTTSKVPPTGRVLRSPREPGEPQPGRLRPRMSKRRTRPMKGRRPAVGRRTPLVPSG